MQQRGKKVILTNIFRFLIILVTKICPILSKLYTESILLTGRSVMQDLGNASAHITADIKDKDLIM